MTAAAPIALAMGFLTLSIVLAIGLIPVLDAEMRRVTARRVAAEAAANHNARASALEKEGRVG